MAATIDATIGGTTSNSYATLAQARAYFDTQFYATDATLLVDDSLTRALITATRVIDDSVAWYGTVTDQNQRLQWPRQGMVKPNGYYIDPHTLPDALVNATAELARQLLIEDRTADDDAETRGLKAVTVGGTRAGITIEFDHPSAKVIPDAVFYMLRWWGSIIARSNPMAPLLRG